MTNTTTLQQIKQSLIKSEERLALVMDATKDGVWDWNIITDEEFFSPRWCEIVGYSHKDPEFIHNFESWKSRIHPDDVDMVMLILTDHLNKGTVYDVDYRHLHKSGKYRWQNSRGKAVRDNQGKPFRMVGCIRDITKRKEKEQELNNLLKQLKIQHDEIHHLANYDELTGLPTLRLMKDRVKMALHRARRTQNHVVILFIDLNGFKQLNDQYGHIFGDHCLKVISQRMSDEIRADETVARIGGDEFLFVGTYLTDHQEANVLTERLLNAISKPISWNDEIFSVTASAGIAVFPEHGDELMELRHKADLAMYRAKKIGKGYIALKI